MGQESFLAYLAHKEERGLVDQSGHAVGILSKTDLLQALQVRMAQQGMLGSS
ncbi:MAG: hypothetical protein M1369_00815 [Deinococcus sp.]|nr:hypothetical protein [Deinococcus sp.]MCL5964319.1 hypothetical protein [Deinococcus sp.]